MPRLMPPRNTAGTRDLAFGLFCAFTISYFIHLTARLPVLGAARFDLLLAGVTLLAALASGPKLVTAGGDDKWPIGKRLLVLIGYIALTLPFVEWPGSVINEGLEPFLKALVFFFFVTRTVDSIAKLKTLTAIFVACQVFRILEPLYMHETTGYWGAFTSLGNFEFMDRLSGSPYDIINPNGLGFLIVTTLPLLHYLIKPNTVFRKILYGAVAAAFLYTMVLSSSRSAFLAFIVLILLAIFRSKNRAAYLAVAIAAGAVSLTLMTDLQRERYMSIFSHAARGSATAEGRLNGVIEDLQVAMRRPLFGYGVGNSREANANFRGIDQLSHDLYTEVAQELGFIGLAYFLTIIVAIVRKCYQTKKMASAGTHRGEDHVFIDGYGTSLLLVVQVLIVFSFASYGMSEPYWYFLGGLVTAAAGLAAKLVQPGDADTREPLRHPRTG